MLLQCLHRQNFDSNVNLVANVKRQMFDEQVVGDKRVFAELDFNGNAILNKISLVVTENRRQPGFSISCFCSFAVCVKV